MSTQAADGGWNYHRDEPQRRHDVDDRRGGRQPADLPAAARRSTATCIRSDAPSKLLTPLTPGGRRRGRATRSRTRPARIEPAVKRGLAWLAGNFTTTSGADRRPVDLLRPLRHRADRRPGRPRHAGPDRLVRAGPAVHPARASRPTAPGTSTHGDEPNTVWAILFLTRSTAKTLERIEVKRLGAGTLLGGRGLPKDLSSLTVAGGRVVSRPMNGAVEGMLAVLEDPRAAERRLGPGRPGRPLPGRGARRAPAAQGPLPQAADRPRPRPPPGRRLGPGPDRRPRRRPRPDRRPGRPRSATWSRPRGWACNCSAARSTGLGPPPARRPSSGRRPRGGGGTGIRRIRPLDLEGQDESIRTRRARPTRPEARDERRRRAGQAATCRRRRAPTRAVRARWSGASRSTTGSRRS